MNVELLIERKILKINMSNLPKKEKQKMIDLLGVKKKLYQKSPIGIPYNFWEENVIRKQFPKFFKHHKRNDKYFSWLPRGA